VFPGGRRPSGLRVVASARWPRLGCFGHLPCPGRGRIASGERPFAQLLHGGIASRPRPSHCRWFTSADVVGTGTSRTQRFLVGYHRMQDRTSSPTRVAAWPRPLRRHRTQLPAARSPGFRESVAGQSFGSYLGIVAHVNRLRFDQPISARVGRSCCRLVAQTRATFVACCGNDEAREAPICRSFSEPSEGLGSGVPEHDSARPAWRLTGHRRSKRTGRTVSWVEEAAGRARPESRQGSPGLLAWVLPWRAVFGSTRR
jgi:hypothetical protein